MLAEALHLLQVIYVFTLSFQSQGRLASLLPDTAVPNLSPLLR